MGQKGGNENKGENGRVMVGRGTNGRKIFRGKIQPQWAPIIKKIAIFSSIQLLNSLLTF